MKYYPTYEKPQHSQVERGWEQISVTSKGCSGKNNKEPQKYSSDKATPAVWGGLKYLLYQGT